MADLLQTSVTGLLAYQRALSTTGHNISNVNTPGYSRQRVEMSATNPQFVGGSYVGSGVQVDTVRRIYDQFLTDQVRSSTSLQSQYQTTQSLASQIDNMLGDPQAGIAPVLQSFFGAMHDLANDPSSTAARQVVLSQAQSVTTRFQDMSQRLDGLRQGVNSQIETQVQEVNALAQSIAGVNQDILNSPKGSGNSQLPNDLLDRRDQLVNELSKYTSLQTVAQDDGTLNVFIGTGQSLVVGTQAQKLAVTRDTYDPVREQISYVSSGGAGADISSQLTGGSLGGVLDFRDNILDPAINNLGRVALGVADSINVQHRLGQSLTGQPGGDFFNTAAPEVLPNTGNTGTAQVSASLNNVSGLTTSNYVLARNGASYTLTRQSDGAVTDLGALGFPGGSVTVDGFTLNVSSGALANGDTFLVRPTHAGAQGLNVAVTNTNDVAAAAPIVTSAYSGNTGTANIDTGQVNSPNDSLKITYHAGGTVDVLDQTTGAQLATGLGYTVGNSLSFNGLTFSLGGTPADGAVFHVDQRVTSPDPANGGSGTISAATVSASATDPNLTNPVTIVFSSPTTYSVVGAVTGTPSAGLTYTSGQAISFNGWTTKLTGTPAAGDTFTISPNSGGVGDNRNALLLANVQNAQSLDSGRTTVGGAYGSMVADVGTRSKQAELANTAQTALLKQSQAARDAVSGVNLDEEAANMVRFQQAYQASAKVIGTASTLFNSLLSALG